MGTMLAYKVTGPGSRLMPVTVTHVSLLSFPFP